MIEENSIGALFHNQVEKYGDRVFLKFKGKGGYKDISWKQVQKRAMGAGLGLLSLGMKEGENVCILSENRPEWVYSDIGILSLGAVDAPIYPTNTPGQCAYIIKDCSARFVIVSTGEQLGKLLKVRDQLDDVEKVIMMDKWAEYPYPDWVIGFDELIRRGLEFEDEKFFKTQVEKVKEDELATLIYTSGTTGEPKGVMLTHGNFLSNCRDLMTYNLIEDTDVSLSFLPLSHSFERTIGYYVGMMAGGTIAYAESMDTLLVNMSEIKPQFMCSVPRFYEKVFSSIKANVRQSSPMKQKIFNWAMGVGGQVSKLTMNKKPVPGLLNAKYKIAEKLVFNQLKEKMGGRLKFFASGGAPLAKEISEFFHAAGILILEGYGLSETSPSLTVNSATDFRFGTVGKAIPSVTLKLNDSDNEILAKGPNIMQGYYNLPDKTKEVMDDEGWFHTGDVGEFDSDGFLTITDRIKDMIKTSGGKYVAPQHVEGLLIQDQFIEQVCVIGDRRQYCTALVVPSFEAVMKWADEEGIEYSDNAELVEKDEVNKLIEKSFINVNKDLPSYETIKQFRLLPEEFSQENNMLTPTLKVRRKIVTQTYEALIDSMYPKD